MFNNLRLAKTLLLACVSFQASAGSISDVISKLDLDQVKYHKTHFRDLYYVQGMSKQQREPTSLFTTADGDVFYMGDVFYVDDDGMAHSLGASEKLKQLNVERPIGFKAQDERAVISVFTDYSCGYCVKFHERVLPLMLKAGISVNYFAFPRGGMVTLEANQLAKAWCSDDPQTAITQLKKGVVIEGEASSPMRNCNDDVLQQYVSGRLFNITGTPTILTQDGYMIEGLPAISASQAVETEEQLEEWLKMMRVVEVE